MPAQPTLPVKLEATEETLTAQGSLALFGAHWHGLGLAGWPDQDLPAPGSGAVSVRTAAFRAATSSLVIGSYISSLACEVLDGVPARGLDAIVGSDIYA